MHREPADWDYLRWWLQEEWEPVIIRSMYVHHTTFSIPEPVRKRQKKTKLQRMLQRAAKRKRK